MAGVLPISLSKKAVIPTKPGALRGGADFLTRRALELAPDNDEVKKLRDDVVKLLEPKTKAKVANMRRRN